MKQLEKLQANPIPILMFHRVSSQLLLFVSKRYQDVDLKESPANLTHNLFEMEHYGNDTVFMYVFRPLTKFMSVVSNTVVLRSKAVLTKKEIGKPSVLFTTNDFIISTSNRAAIISRNATVQPVT